VNTFTQAQRWTALGYGLVTHLVFLAAVTSMFVSLYHGLRVGLIHLHGVAAWSVNVLLIAQFALGHTWLLSDQGRRFITKLAPLNLGKPLATTIFAALASIQLLLVFALWSPSAVLWAAPEGWLRSTLTGCYIASWLLLMKSMSDAGLEIQMGYLGWRSVWKNAEPKYRPFTRGGLFKWVRQPIYLSFTLILWTAPTWTPDHLVIAILWTAYCYLAPFLKELRYRRWYGAPFARYQKRVPYWNPMKKQPTEPAAVSTEPLEHEVAIVGGGPVGLLLACLLGQRGIRVLVLEKAVKREAWSQAIGITPPTLQIMAKLGLDEAMIARGVKIRDCQVYGESGHVGVASFREIEGRHRFVLSLPQAITMELLDAEAARHPSVKILRGVEVTAKQQDAHGVTLTLNGNGEGQTIRAGYVAACDGHRSRMRDLLKMRTSSKDYGCHFIMGDFEGDSGLGDDAHLFFTATGAVESFPLPGQRRRWIVQAHDGSIPALVQQRTGIQLEASAQLDQHAFGPRRLDCDQLYDGRILLCGDAAHVMSPIGGQGMNTGFADAEFAAEMLHAILRNDEAPEPLLAAYNRVRRRASSAAATRAAIGMGIGVWTGHWRSLLRDFIFRRLVFGGPFAGLVGPWFSMQSIPGGTLQKVSCRQVRRLLALDAMPPSAG
jgi:2-polyprenyl-6-methoxyphenol hydroxylase-like FAD-dependent oxidoreductase/protein-S-isoprenylcysteine O-methyltransferase Ste14